MVYAWCVEQIAPDKLEEWTYMLNAPLPGENPRAITPRQAEDEGASFMALYNAQKPGA